MPRFNRQSILTMLEDERQLIMQRYIHDKAEPGPLPVYHGLRWYLDISKQWAVQHLSALGELPPGDLLDIGAYYGLIAGVAFRMGWRVSAVDSGPVPSYSSLRIPERRITCDIYNACTDKLPFPDGSFNVVVLSEVLEHIMYSPLPMFREIHRVLKPEGRLFISTPNPGNLGRLIGLAMGRATIEPPIESILAEDQTYQYKGLTFFKNHRESKLWTCSEIKLALERCGMTIDKSYYYGNTVPLELMSRGAKLRSQVLRLILPLVKQFPISGGSTFVSAKPMPEAPAKSTPAQEVVMV